MGTQAMSAQGDSGGQQSQIQSLARQGSLYNLTLNEVETHLGEPLNSMNLDELLKTVIPGEMIVPSETNGLSVQPVPVSSGLQRQGSITMPQGLSKKTVDEVWRDIQQEQKKSSENHQAGERQPSLGEMTLEAFLTKVGIFSEESTQKSQDTKRNVDPMSTRQDFLPSSQWLQQQYHQPQNIIGGYVSGRSVLQPMGVGARSMIDTMYPDVHVNISSPTVGTLSDSHTPGRKRGATFEMMDKMLERRHKRMIKNRESAARSRARKQAYTNELENKVSRLEEENGRLRKQKEFDTVLSIPPPEPKYQLRRTSSAPF